MKFFSGLFTIESRANEAIGIDERVRWLRNPLSHPLLEAMSERELADLPFHRGTPIPPEAPAGVCR